MIFPPGGFCRATKVYNCCPGNYFIRSAFWLAAASFTSYVTIFERKHAAFGMQLLDRKWAVKVMMSVPKRDDLTTEKVLPTKCQPRNDSTFGNWRWWWGGCVVGLVAPPKIRLSSSHLIEILSSSSCCCGEEMWLWWHPRTSQVLSTLYHF